MSEEEWDFVEGLKQTRSSCVCMTCQHFSYVCDQHCHTLLTCGPVSYTHLTLPTILLV